MEASACLALPFAAGEALLSLASWEVACSSKESLGVATRLALPLGVTELSVEGRESRMKNCRGFSRGTKMLLKLLGLLIEEVAALVSGSDRVSTLLLAYLST